MELCRYLQSVCCHRRCFLLRPTLIVKLNTYFGKDLVILSGNGVASILGFRSKASSVLQVVDDDEDDLNESIAKVAKTIALECKQLKQDGQSYQTRIAPDSITADNSLVMGREQMEDFESSWPDSCEGFYRTISKKVVVMSTLKKHMKIGQTPVYDTNLIYSRVIGLQNARNINMKDVLEYELFPVPTSLYEDKCGS